MKWIGLTGGIASGKSTVAEIMRRHHINVIDADHIAHELMRPGESAYKQIILHFGRDLLNPDQTLDRKKLGERVFAKPGELAALEAILHPLIKDRVRELRKKLEVAGHGVAVYDVPLLYEKDMASEFDDVVCVVTTRELQKARLQSRSQLTDEQIEMRLRAQLPLEHKRGLATHVIENNGSLSELEDNVERLVETLKTSGSGPKKK